MSEQYEGVVFRAAERTARQAFAGLSSKLRLRLVRLARGIFGIYRMAGHADPFDQPAIEQIAQQMSVAVGQAVTLLYDNGCCLRLGILYRSGQREREFGDNDAWWVPYGPDGELHLNGPRFRVSELQPEAEYDCVFSAIDASLAAVGAGPRVTPALLKHAFCYEECKTIAER